MSNTVADAEELSTIRSKPPAAPLLRISNAEAGVSVPMPTNSLVVSTTNIPAPAAF